MSGGIYLFDVSMEQQRLLKVKNSDTAASGRHIILLATLKSFHKAGKMFTPQCQKLDETRTGKWAQ